MIRSALEIRDAVRAGKSKARDACEEALDRIRRHDPAVRAFQCVDETGARAAADAVDASVRAGGDPGILAGVPVAVKDNFCTRFLPTTCSSKILEGWVAPYEATVVRRLRDAGAVIVGKTNLDEFAMGSSTENSAYFTTRNPWDVSRVPGGSSGGSAAAVAAGMVPISYGSDTGGSIRQPASLCGVLGMKPTWGRVSRYGLVAFASSLDQIGPFTRNACDLGLALQAVAGHDALDSTSLEAAVPDGLASARPRDLSGLRVGLVREHFAEGLDAEVGAVVQSSLAALERRGARLVDVSLPSQRFGIPVYYLVATAEASSNLARYDGVRYGPRESGGTDPAAMTSITRGKRFGPEVRRRILLGTFALSAGYYDAYYLKALKVRTLIRRDFEAAFAMADVLAGPTSPTTAFKVGERSADPIQMYLSDIYTTPANLAGLPALSVPAGLSKAGLPVGLHLHAPSLAEDRLISVAAALAAAGICPPAVAPAFADGETP